MNPYQVLEINKYSSKDEIRLAYKRLMKKHHPTVVTETHRN